MEEGGGTVLDETWKMREEREEKQSEGTERGVGELQDGGAEGRQRRPNRNDGFGYVRSCH